MFLVDIVENQLTERARINSAAMEVSYWISKIFFL